MKEVSVLRTFEEGNLCCPLPLGEKQRIRALTGKLRTSPITLYKRLRQLFEEKGIDIAASYLAQIFDDGPALVFGVIVTSESRIFQFDFCWSPGDSNSGHFSRWQKIPEEYTANAWKEQINLALELVEETETP